jgi:hypothetical protein
MMSTTTHHGVDAIADEVVRRLHKGSAEVGIRPRGYFVDRLTYAAWVRLAVENRIGQPVEIEPTGDGEYLIRLVSKPVSE